VWVRAPVSGSIDFERGGGEGVRFGIGCWVEHRCRLGWGGVTGGAPVSRSISGVGGGGEMCLGWGVGCIGLGPPPTDQPTTGARTHTPAHLRRPHPNPNGTGTPPNPIHLTPH
jgi:hypothetical protein